MVEQLEMVFEQSDDFYLAKNDFEEAQQELKLMTALLTKYQSHINSTIREKQIRMQMLCNHPVKYIEEHPDLRNNRQVDFIEYCEICGKIVRNWTDEIK